MSRWPSAVACLAMLCFGLLAQAMPTLPIRETHMSVRPVTASAEIAPLSLGAPTSPTKRFLPGPYIADAIRIIDGDTFETKISLWLGLEITTKIRLAGIDAPEIHGKCAEESRRALEARDQLVSLLEKAPIRIVDVRPDKYNGRVVARALDRDNRDVSEMMLAAGQAIAYNGGRKTSLCDGWPARATASR